MASRAGLSTQSRGKKNRKWGRAKRGTSHNAYNADQRWKINKRRKLAKYVRNNPNDLQAALALRKL
jgi:hypothetical protein